MPQEPAIKRTIAFFDGQNLFHHAQEAFGYIYPNYSPLALASKICSINRFNLHEIRFYTGIPTPQDDQFWNGFLVGKTSGHVTNENCDLFKAVKIPVKNN